MPFFTCRCTGCQDASPEEPGSFVVKDAKGRLWLCLELQKMGISFHDGTVNHECDKSDLPALLNES
jgi:hypothetical protein